jgi:hypothetical protein
MKRCIKKSKAWKFETIEVGIRMLAVLVIGLFKVEEERIN